MDIKILHSSHFESELSNSVRRPDSPSYIALTNLDSNTHSYSRENEIRYFAGKGQSSREADSYSEIVRLSGELNQRITQEMNVLMSSVSSQIQKAINEAINEQVLPQIQAILKSGQGQVSRKVLKLPAERPEYRVEEAFNRMFRSSSRDEFPRDVVRDEDVEDTYYTKSCLLFRDQLRKASEFPKLSFRKNQNTRYESVL